jgi:hypothetical protein
VTTRRKRTPKELEAQLIYGKGWSVGEISHNTQNHAYPYVALVIFGRKLKCVGARKSKDEAARLAVCAARHYGTLDWSKTVRWFKVMGYELDSADTFEFSIPKRAKGWFVLKREHAYIAYTGTRNNLKTVCSRKSRYVAVQHAINAAKSMPNYDEAATILWLQRNRMDDLIEMARVRRAA